MPQVRSQVKARRNTCSCFAYMVQAYGQRIAQLGVILIVLAGIVTNGYWQISVLHVSVVKGEFIDLIVGVFNRQAG